MNFNNFNIKFEKVDLHDIHNISKNTLDISHIEKNNESIILNINPNKNKFISMDSFLSKKDSISYSLKHHENIINELDTIKEKSLLKKTFSVHFSNKNDSSISNENIIHEKQKINKENKLNQNISIPDYVHKNKEKLLFAVKINEPQLILECKLILIIILFLDLFENIFFAFQMNSINFLDSNLEIIGKTYLSMADFKNAIFTYNLIRHIGNISGNLKIKINGLMGLSKICLLMKKFDLSLKILKKILEYAWWKKNIKLELEIYDKIGYIYFMNNQIDKAKYYHMR